MLEREAFLVFRGFCPVRFNRISGGHVLWAFGVDVSQFSVAVILAFLLCVSVFFPLSTHPSFFFVVIQVNQPRFVYKCLCVCLFNWSHNTKYIAEPCSV